MKIDFRKEYAAVFLIFFLLGATWAGIMPLWQDPDEPAHFAYVQYMEYHITPPRQNIVPAGQAPWVFNPSEGETAAITYPSATAF
jgi:hypothetical protein